MITIGVFCDNPDTGVGFPCFEADPFSAGMMRQELVQAALDLGWALVTMTDGSHRMYCPDCGRVADQEIGTPHSDIREVMRYREPDEVQALADGRDQMAGTA